MHPTRNHTLLLAAPVLAYLALLLLVAALVQPPLLGWLGLAVVAVVGAALVAGAAVLFPRMRTNVARAPAAGAGLLVVADATCDSASLCDVVGRHVGHRLLPVRVLAPVLASPLHYVSNDEEREREAAIVRLDAMLADLRAAGIPADGQLGTDDPVQAIGDALATFPAGELVLVTSASSHWLELDLLTRARELVPTVDHVVVHEAVPA